MGGFGSNPGNFEKLPVAGLVEVDRKVFGVKLGPGQFGVGGLEEVALVVEGDVVGGKAIKPQEKVGLVKTMFPG